MSVRELTSANSLIQVPGEETSLLREVSRPGERLERAVVAVCERVEPLDPDCVLRRALKVGALVISAAGKIAFLPVSFQLGPKWGPVSAVGESASYFILESWASFGMIDDFFGPKTQAEIDLIGKEERGSLGRTCTKALVVSAAGLLALASQLPSTLPAMKFAPEHYQVLAGGVTLLAGSLLPLRSMQLGIDHAREGCRKSKEAKVTALKERLVGLLMARRDDFIRMSRENKGVVIRACDGVRSLETIPQDKTREYLKVLLEDRQTEPRSRCQEITSKVFDYTGLGLGTLLAGALQYVTGDYTYESAQTELDVGSPVAGVLATMTVAATCYLGALAIIRTTRKVFNVIGDLATRRECRNLSWQLRPKTTGALTGMGFITNFSTLLVTYIILNSFYKNKDERDVFLATTSFSLMLLLSTSTLSIIDDSASFSIARGSEEEKGTLALSRDYQRLAALISKCPSRELIGYLLEDNRELLGKMGLEETELRDLVLDLD